MSLVTAVVGAGMLLAVAGFFMGGPLIGGGVFVMVWIAAVASIIGYHLWNAFSPHGVDHTQFHFRTQHESSDRKDLPPGA
jgi:hypothetical protein